MMKNKENGKNLKRVTVFILIGLVICVLVMVISIGTEKADVEKRMTELTVYIKNQCIRYDETVLENSSSMLFSVADKACDFRRDMSVFKEIGYGSLEDEVDLKRLTGIIFTNDVTGKVYVSTLDGKDYDFWAGTIEKYRSVVDCKEKIYIERLYGNDGYCYDYVVLSREDVEGIILCYIRNSIEALSGAQLSIRTLLKGYNFERNGTVVVTDGITVIASNNDEYYNIPATECPVVKNVRHMDEYDNLVISDGHYAMRTKAKDYYVYAYIPMTDVFVSSSLLLAYLMLAYVLFVFILFFIRQSFLQTKRFEKEKADAAYREELDRIAKEAIRANEVKSDFLRRMSHDVRTPINGIRGMIKIGEYYADDLEKQKECREKVWEASGYLLELVNSVLDMSKLDTSEFTPKKECFVLSELLEEVNSTMQYQAAENSINYVTDFIEITHDHLYGAAVSLKRVCMNLAANAIKYNKVGGSINVSCKETENADGKAKFRFVVSDTGIGMTPEFQKVMFEPFEQENADKETAESSAGVGLGLAIVKKTIDGLGGNISVSSKKDVGTTFVFSLEFEVDRDYVPDAIEPVAVKDDKSLKDINVLVVEDNELNLEIAEFMLKTKGANVISASDGKAAVEKFAESREFSIDVILMDIMMPVMSGLEAAEKIRRMQRADAQTVAIIAMTANAFEDDVEIVKAAGMNGHIAKPVDAQKLVDTIRKIRGGGRRRP